MTGTWRERAVWWELGLCVPGLCGEGFRGADFGFTLLLPSSPLPKPPAGTTNWNPTRNRGQGAGGYSPYRSASWDTGQGDGYSVPVHLGGRMNLPMLWAF